MPSASYPYIDICALDAVRARFAAGDALAVLTPALDEVLWANGAGAALFGYSDVSAIIGEKPEIGLAAKRQIMATSGYPRIGKNRAVTVRLASGLMSRAVAFAGSEIVLPDGADAILLATPAPPASWRTPVDTAGRAIAGLDREGQHVALVGADGRLVAASPDFDGLGIDAETLGELVAETRGERVVKRLIEAGAMLLPAGFLRLTDDPATHLLLVVDKVVTDRGEGSADTRAEAGVIGQDLAPPAELRQTEPAATAEQLPATEARDGAGDMEEAETPAADGNDVPDQVAAVIVEAQSTASDEPATAAVADTGEGSDVSVEGAEPPSVATSAAPIPAAGVEHEHVEHGDWTAGNQAGSAEPPASDTAETGTVDAADIAALMANSGDAEVATAGAALAASVEEAVDEPAAQDLPQEPTVSADGAPTSEPATDEATASEIPADDADAPTTAGEAPLPAMVIDRSAIPVRFVWKTDAAGHFSEIGREFVATVGEPAADLIGLSFRQAAAKLGIDPSQEIAGLLERHDTWSGRAVLWPVAGTDLRIPVDLAALPTYDRDRTFAGFRGFGVARAGDAVVDPDATGLALLERGAQSPTLAKETPADRAPAVEPAEPSSAKKPPAPADPFQGEPPILTIVPKQDRRSSDKVIRLAEHRQPTVEKGLSAGERNAFREIGDRLKKDGAAPLIQGAAEPAMRADNDRTQRADRAATTPSVRMRGEDGESEEPRPAAEVETDAGNKRPIAGDAAADGGSRGEEDAAAAAFAASEQTPPPAEAEPHALEPEPEMLRDDGEMPADESEASGAEDMPAEPDTAADDGSSTATAFASEAADADAELAAEQAPDPAPLAAPAAEPAPQPDYLPSAFALGSAGGERAPVDTSILEKLPVPVLIHSGDQLHYANREFFDLTGYDSVEEFDEAGGLGVLFGEPYPAKAGEPEGGRKLRLRTSEGLEYPVEAFLQSVPWGERKALLLSLRRSWRHPISYPVAAAAPPAAAADVEARISEMRAIVDTATDGVVLIAPDGTIRSISSPAEALFGFDSADVAGKPFTSLFAIESQRAARDYLNGLSENGVASVLNDGREVIGREAQGRFIPLFMTIGKLPNDSGFCAVLRDITQWKRAEEDLTQARAHAERASSQKTDFLARVSHEIRTPLNAIIGFSELMLDEKFGPVGNDRYRDYLRDINRSGNHVLDLVNDLLDISKIEAGQQEMSYEAVSLNDTLGETVAMMQPAANRERVIIRSSFAARLPEVVADLRSVRQIALNLLSNAVRYTPAGGQVIVSTAYEASGDVVMRVRDTGIGMSQAEIEQALKPFKQINTLKRARGDGTGLGLPLTKAMVEANRARFIINSTPGEGTLVEVSFPSTRVLAD